MDSAQSQSIRQARVAVVVVAVTAVAEVILRFVQPAMVRFSSSRSSPIRATSTRTRVVPSVVRASIFTSLHTAAECSLTSLVRRGRSTHAPTTLSCGITSHPPRIERASSLVRRPSRRNRVQKVANTKNRRALRHLPPSQFRHASRRGRRLAGCRLWLRGLSLDR